jgi:hypothetical protein
MTPPRIAKVDHAGNIVGPEHESTSYVMHPSDVPEHAGMQPGKVAKEKQATVVFVPEFDVGHKNGVGK